ncbi:hypothetical protein RCSAXON_28 [Rhodobacter phage RcSaxon]|uniref:Uncharacterized protein n=1 Tax=Rhodobacter phage RcSaxon TaxID=1698423 RepID=A0A0K1Y6H1_9CAUD|nr:hypothetical protein RCSAXON_28 [Rhodobacter phage RcSaxon]
MKRPGYREAIQWLALNDDCEWLNDGDNWGPIISVTAALVRDLFDVDEQKLFTDLRQEVAKADERRAAERKARGSFKDHILGQGQQ